MRHKLFAKASVFRGDKSVCIIGLDVLLINKYIGYLPPKNAYAYDGHETNSNYTYRAKMAPGSIEKACDTVISDIEKLF